MATIRYIGRGKHTIVLSGVGKLRFPGPDVEVPGDVAEKLLQLKSPGGTPLYQCIEAEVIETLKDVELPDPPKRLFRGTVKEPGTQQKSTTPRKRKPKGPQPDIFSTV